MKCIQKLAKILCESNQTSLHTAASFLAVQTIHLFNSEIYHRFKFLNKVRNFLLDFPITVDEIFMHYMEHAYSQQQ